MDILKVFSMYDTNYSINIQGTIENPLFQINQIGKLLDIKNIRNQTSKLNDTQSRALESHLEETTYTRVIDICAYIEKTYAVRYTVSGLTKWLHQHSFSYKQPKTVPAKADLAKQELNNLD